MEDRFPGVRSVARDIPISEHSRVGVVAGHIGQSTSQLTQIVIDAPLVDVVLDGLALLVAVAEELEFIEVREVVAVVAVDPLLDVGLPFLVVPRPECEAVVLIVEAVPLEVLRGGVGAAAEFVHVVVGDVGGVQEVDKHVLDADVAGPLYDAVDLLDDLLGGHDLAVALDLPVVLGVLAETGPHLHDADVATMDIGCQKISVVQ